MQTIDLEPYKESIYINFPKVFTKSILNILGEMLYKRFNEDDCHIIFEGDQLKHPFTEYEVLNKECINSIINYFVNANIPFILVHRFTELMYVEYVFKLNTTCMHKVDRIEAIEQRVINIKRKLTHYSKQATAASKRVLPDFKYLNDHLDNIVSIYMLTNSLEALKEYKPD